MRMKSLQVPVAIPIAIVAFGANEMVRAGAVVPARITICYSRSTGVVRFARSARCAVGSSRVVIGRGIAGVRGPAGPTGPIGPAGAPGAAGAIGGTGTSGFAGATGGTGPQGNPGAVGGTGGAGGTGATGGTGLQGNSGVNALHTVLSAPATSGFGTVTAMCATNEVVTGGGFTTAASTGVVTIKDSNPTFLRDGWQIAFSGGPTINVVAYAICVSGSNS